MNSTYPPIVTPTQYPNYNTAAYNGPYYQTSSYPYEQSPCMAYTTTYGGQYHHLDQFQPYSIDTNLTTPSSSSRSCTTDSDLNRVADDFDAESRLVRKDDQFMVKFESLESLMLEANEKRRRSSLKKQHDKQSVEYPNVKISKRIKLEFPNTESSTKRVRDDSDAENILKVKK